MKVSIFWGNPHILANLTSGTDRIFFLGGMESGFSTISLVLATSVELNNSIISTSLEPILKSKNRSYKKFTSM